MIRLARSYSDSDNRSFECLQKLKVSVRLFLVLSILTFVAGATEVAYYPPFAENGGYLTFLGG